MSENETVWSDDATNTASQADYQELQRQYDQLQTELFNERKKSAGLERIVEANALVHISAHNAEISAQAQERYKTLLMAVAAGTRWPNGQYPFNSAVGCLRLQPFRPPKRPNFLTGQGVDDGKTVELPIYEYDQRDFFNAMRVIAEIQADALKKSAEKLRFALVDGGPRWAIRYEQQMYLAEEILAKQEPI